MHVMTHLIRNRARKAQQRDSLIESIVEIVTDPRRGGLHGFIDRFSEAGLREEARSWVGSGKNKAITPAQLEAVLGSDLLTSLADRSDVPREEIAEVVADILPEIINRLTPFGAVEELPDTETTLSGLKKLLSAVG